jgi:hypothetical protein
MRWLDRFARREGPDTDVRAPMAAAHEAAGRDDYATALDSGGIIAAERRARTRLPEAEL